MRNHCVLWLLTYTYLHEVRDLHPLHTDDRRKLNTNTMQIKSDHCDFEDADGLISKQTTKIHPWTLPNAPNIFVTRGTALARMWILLPVIDVSIAKHYNKFELKRSFLLVVAIVRIFQDSSESKNDIRCQSFCCIFRQYQLNDQIIMPLEQPFSDASLCIVVARSSNPTWFVKLCLRRWLIPLSCKVLLVTMTRKVSLSEDVIRTLSPNVPEQQRS